MTDQETKININGNQEKSEPGPLIGVRHLQFFLLFITLLIFYGHRTCLSVAVIAMTDENPPSGDIPTYPDWASASTDTILSSFFWGYLIPQVGAGQLGEFFGPKWFLVGTMTIGSIFHILVPTMAEALGPTGVIICRVIQGLTQGFLYPSIHNIISKWTPLYERSRIASFVYAGGTLGVVVSMLITGVICGSDLGWPSAFYFYGGGGVIWAIIFAIFACNAPSQHKSISMKERNYIESSNSVSNEAKEKIPTPWKSIVTSLPFLSILVTTCGVSWGGFTLLTEIPGFMSNILDYDISSNSALSSLPYVFMFIMSLVGAPFADKLIEKKILSIGVTRKIFNTIGMMVPAAALFGLGFLDSSDKDLALVLLIAAVGMTGILNASYIVNIIDLAPNHAGTLLGISNGTSTIFSILGPLSVQFWGTDKKDPMLWRKVFWLASGFYVVTSLFYLVFSSGEVQKWNFTEDKPEDSEKRSSTVSNK